MHAEAKSARLSTSYLVARFIRFYGMDSYRDARWPTRDGVIPVRLFFPMLEALGNVQAAEELQQYYATLLAAGQVWGGPEQQAAIGRAVAVLRSTAYPDTPDVKTG